MRGGEKMHCGSRGRHHEKHVQCGSAHILLRQVASPDEEHGCRRRAIKQDLCDERAERGERRRISFEPAKMLARGPICEPWQTGVQSHAVREDRRQVRSRFPQTLHMEMEKDVQPKNQHRTKKGKRDKGQGRA